MKRQLQRNSRRPLGLSRRRRPPRHDADGLLRSPYNTCRKRRPRRAHLPLTDQDGCATRWRASLGRHQTDRHSKSHNPGHMTTLYDNHNAVGISAFCLCIRPSAYVSRPHPAPSHVRSRSPTAAAGIVGGRAGRDAPGRRRCALLYSGKGSAGRRSARREAAGARCPTDQSRRPHCCGIRQGHLGSARCFPFCLGGWSPFETLRRAVAAAVPHSGGRCRGGQKAVFGVAPGTGRETGSQK